MTGSLFPQNILRIGSVVDGDAVPGEYGSTPVFAFDNEGRQWVKKVLMGANELLAESIGWLLSGALGVPTPRAAICGQGSDAIWLSERAPTAGRWKQSRAQFLKNPDALGAMIALDAIIGNWDRHGANILLLPEGSSGQFFVSSIDLASSWIGTPSDITQHMVDVPDIDRLANGIPVDLIRTGAEACAKAAAKLNHSTIREYVSEGCEIASERNFKTVEEALRRRCEDAPRLVQVYLERIEGRR